MPPLRRRLECALLLVLLAVCVPGRAQTIPPASSSAAADVNRETAAALFRKAMAIPDPSQEKVELLTQAALMDPAVTLYNDERRAAAQALLEKKQEEVKAQEQNAREVKQRENAKAAGEQTQDLMSEAAASRRKGDLAAAKTTAVRAVEVAQQSGDAALLDRAKRLAAAVDGDIAFRTRLWQGLAAAAIAGAGAAFLLLKKRTRKLQMVEGPEPGRVFKLDKDVTTIGAVDTDADIVIADEYRNISRRHCQIARSGRHFFLEDCSRNGTFINGRAVPRNKPVLLRANDEITLCDSVILIYR